MLRHASGILGSLAAQSLQQSLAEGGLATALRVLSAKAALTTSAAPPARYQVTARGMADEPLPPIARQGSTVVLVSGGIESAALLSYYTHWDHAQTLLPLFVDYGQRNARAEEVAQRAVCRHLGLEMSAINASMVAHQLGMATSGRRHHDPLPHRNLLLLSLAASYGADSGAANVALCLTRDDLGTYSSASQPFLHRVQALYEALSPPATLVTPLVSLSRAQVITLGQQVHAPWELTYSCVEGMEAHCGTCHLCTQRAEAFEKAGVVDPLVVG